MNDTPYAKLLTDSYWSRLSLMAILAAGIFVALEYMPALINGVVGTIAAVVVASVLLYSFGRVAGQMIGENADSNPTLEN